MRTRTLFEYIASVALGIFTLFPYFLYGGEVSSRQMIWVRSIIVAALLFSPVGLLGRPQFRFVLVFCLPVAVISSILGFAESHNFWLSLKVTAEPILCALLGASFAWVVFRVLPLRA